MRPGKPGAASLGETPEHIRAKASLVKAFRQRGMRVEPEVTLKLLASEEDRRADVVVYGPRTGKPLAFEVQHSLLQLSDIIRRTASYLGGGISAVGVSCQNLGAL